MRAATRAGNHVANSPAVTRRMQVTVSVHGSNRSTPWSWLCRMRDTAVAPKTPPAMPISSTLPEGSGVLVTGDGELEARTKDVIGFVAQIRAHEVHDAAEHEPAADQQRRRDGHLQRDKDRLSAAHGRTVGAAAALAAQAVCETRGTHGRPSLMLAPRVAVRRPRVPLRPVAECGSRCWFFGRINRTELVIPTFAG